MKKILIALIVVLSFSFSLQAQNWLDSRKEAVSVASNNNKKIIVYASKDFESVSAKLLEDKLFNSEAFKAIASNFVLLKLDISADSINQRWAAHYSGTKSLPFIALIDSTENSVGRSLNVINSENIRNYINFLKESIK